MKTWLLALATLVAGWIAVDPSVGIGQDNAGQPAQEEKGPLVDGEPYDLIILDEVNDSARLEVLPVKNTAESINQTYAINLPVPVKPFPYDDRGTLKFQLVEFPEKFWQVPWANVVEIKLFEDLLMDEADKYLRQGEFDLYFRTLIYLQDTLGKADSLEVRQMFDRCLAEDGQKALNEQRFDDALATFEELYRRNPRWQSGGQSALDVVISCYDRMVRANLDIRDFRRALDVIDLMETKYGDRMRVSIDDWLSKIDDEARVELERVRQVVAQGNSEDAHRAVRKLVHVMPNLREAHEMFQNVTGQFPHVYIGVTQPTDRVHPGIVHDWAARRIGRLTHRWLFEFNGLTDDGGDYEFPIGTFTRVDDQGLRYRFDLDNTNSKYAVPPITSFEISNRLLAMADDTHPDYYVPWARILESVEMDGDYGVIINLRSPYVRPEALLQTSFMRSDSENYQVANGKYRQAEQRDEQQETIYQRNEAYDPLPGNQHPHVIERVYPSASAAGEALIQGQVDIVDRIHPADRERLRRDPNIEVRPYSVPTVHVLIPNPRNLHMKSVSFRRSLTYAVDRKNLVREFISNGRTIDGYTPVSGPFPPGSDKTEEISYAYNPTMEARPTSGQLAIVLAATVEEAEKLRIKEERKKQEEQRLLEQMKEKEESDDPQAFVEETEQAEGEKEEEKIVVERPTFILVHPDNELVENLCKAMKAQWALVDINVELKKLPPGKTMPEDDDYDLLYMELFMQEPMVDAYQLFGSGGIIGSVDATIRQALYKLDEADSWSEVASSLRRIHHQSFNNMTVVPLWQIIDHYAYRTHMNNLGNDLVHLYRDVEQWEIAPQVPIEEPEE